MIRRDLPDVLRIECDAFGSDAWTECEFIECLRMRNCIGMVAELDNEVVGYMLYQLHLNELVLLNLAVDEKHRFSGHGRALTGRLCEKLSNRRFRAVCMIRERNVAAQVFFRSVGWRCFDIARQPYMNDEDDAYVFERRYVDVIAQQNADYFAGVDEQ